MKVLVACEFSGRVRDAFLAMGHDAWSCDIIDSDTPWPCNHIKKDVIEVIYNWKWQWDMMLAFPPCTYLSSAGLHWNNRIVGRKEKTEQAFNFFMSLFNAPIDKVCVENPIGYIGSHFRKANQIINPHQFGHPERKRTCLWLRGLPLLKATKIVEPEKPKYICRSGRKLYFTDSLSPSKDRCKIRSTTFQGIADAMAEQWGLK